MGCDIHLFVEHKSPNRTRWQAFGEQHRPGRDYEIFSLLAGVRAEEDGLQAIDRPRGVPADLSWAAQDANRLYIVDTEEAGEGEAPRKDAERWIRQGNSKPDGEHHVTHPDWHSHSWLTADEFEQCVNIVGNVESEYKAIIAALRCFESLGEQARVVFWFDN